LKSDSKKGGDDFQSGASNVQKKGTITQFQLREGGCIGGDLYYAFAQEKERNPSTGKPVGVGILLRTTLG